MAKPAVMGVRGALFFLILLLASAGACSTEYKRPVANRTPSPSNGGTVSAGTGGGSGGFPVAPSSGGSTATSTGGRPHSEPPGDNVLTLVNGIVDAPKVLLCLTDGAGPSAPGIGAPFPEGGLDYGAALVLDELDELELDRNALTQAVIAGELELLAGMDCEAAVELARSEQARGGSGPGADASAGGAGGGVALEQEVPVAGAAPGAAGAGGEGGVRFPTLEPPRLRVGALPIVPAGTLSSGYSLLLVGTGCIGGPAFVVDGHDLACGAQYSGEHPTLSGTLVRMGRKHLPGKLGLQVLHASLASDEIEVRSVLSSSGNELPLLLSAQHAYGEITPEQPRLEYPASSYGVGSRQGAVQVMQAGSVLYSESWSTIIDRSGLQILDDRSYTLVLVGPTPGLPARFFWNEPRVVLVENDPTRPQ